jgi:hypothetical protein
MALDLEQHLKDLCVKQDPKLDLYDRLIRARTSAESIWKEQRLKWFTDHGAKTHSRYIIQHLGRVLEYIQTTPQQLNAHELYILLVACYLHDIGMQNFHSLNGKSADQFSDEDYNFIRKNHPEKTRDLIITRTLKRDRDEFHIDLDDDPQYLVPIALVSQGHGSDFFSKTVEELNTIPHRPGNMPLRGGLLTALLLMGDELDLHEKRATFPEEFSLSPISLLHNHIHHYVTGVEIIEGRTPKHRRIRLTFEFPQDSDEYRNDIRAWVTTKLRKQINLTNAVLEHFSSGEMMWDNHIEIREAIDRYGVRRSLLTPKNIHALHELRRELISGQTVNRNTLISAIRGALTAGIATFRAMQVIDTNNSDWSHIVKQVKAICICSRISCIHIGFHISAGHSVSDILIRMACELKKSGALCSTYDVTKQGISENQPEAFIALANSLISDIKEYNLSHPFVLIIERIDKADSDVSEWFLKWLLPELAKHDIKTLLIFTDLTSEQGDTMIDNLQIFQLAPFTKDQILEHLQSEFGLPLDEADNEATYLYSLNSGIPSGIHSGFAVKRREGVIFI